MKEVKLSIIVCTYNRDDFISFCLESLKNQTLECNKYEIVLINNNSTDNTENICLKFQKDNPDINFNYKVEKKQGLSAARNRGLKEACSSVVSFIDDDTIICQDYAKEAVLFYDRNRDVLALGGKILPKFESTKPVWMSKYLKPLMSVIDLGDKEKPFPKGAFPIGANMIFKKEIFNSVGFFDENLGRTEKKMLGSEEKDIFTKLRKKGGKIYYSPKPWVYHQVPDRRLTMEFVKKQAIGIGFSERIRSFQTGTLSGIFSFIKEILKWVASIILFIGYGFSLQLQKSVMIIRFRYWVSLGMFIKREI